MKTKPEPNSEFGGTQHRVTLDTKRHSGDLGRLGRRKKRNYLKNFKVPQKSHNIVIPSALRKELDTSGKFSAEGERKHTYRILDFFFVFETISQVLCCKRCKGNC